jgi:type II secretory pathway predicted ATPase ExeA
MLLTGEAGTGKTTLINHLLHWLEHHRARTAFIFNSHLDSEQLFDFIFSEFEIPVTPQAKANPLLAFNDWLLARYRAHDLVVLIVDEGQGLPIHVLEEIRLLSNMELPNEKLLQIILVGQPELEAKLRRPDLRQLQQRIGLRCRTAPLTLEEVAGYIENRLHTAGSAGDLVFEPEAVEAVHSYSSGIPRVINLLCENALINAYVEHIKVIPAALVAEAARELQFDTFRPVPPPRLRTIGQPADVSDLHAILAKIKADADAWQEKPRATPYLVTSQKAMINHRGDAFSAGDAERNDTRPNSAVPASSLKPEYATARVRVWKQEPAGNFLSANLASARARRAIDNLRSSFGPAIGSLRRYDLEGKLRRYSKLVRIHGFESTVRTIRNLQLDSRIRRSAKRVQAHGVEPALRSLRSLELNSKLKNCVNRAASLTDSAWRWCGRNFNEEAYGKTLIASILAGYLLIEIFLRMNLAQAAQHPGRIIIGCGGILSCVLYLTTAVSILLRARHKVRADSSELLARVLRWLRAPMSSMQTRALSSAVGKIHRRA